MSLSSTAVKRPVATAMVFLALTLIGAYSFSKLRVDLFPELDFPSISVITTYPGVSPEEMETLVTRPIEEAVARVEGIERLESFSSEGRSRVALRFDWGVELESALNDVRAAAERARAQLPEDIDPPVVYKFDLTNIPVVYLALSADMDEARMRRFADDVVKPLLERTPGVAAVDVRGARDREVRVEVDPEALAAYEVTVNEITAALRDANLTVPAGLVESGAENILVRAMSEFENLDDVRDALVVERNGEVVRIRDVATVVDGFEEIVNIVRINGAMGVTLTITKSPDANTIEVADAVYDAVDRFNRDYDGVASLRITTDSSTFIRRSISSVQQSVLVGAGLALIVLMVFLRSLRSTFVIGVAIPISVIATFLLMYQLDLTLNLISFGGLALGIGMLVDNSIVILEAIHRRGEMGDPPLQAALRGSREVGSAIVASTLTTLAVFAPVIFLGGFAAVFFSQMALVVTSALVCSLFVALTLVPVLASIVRPKQSAASPDGGYGWMERTYGHVVGWAVRHPIIVVLVSIGTLAGAITQSDRIGSELLPESDESEVRIFAQYPVGTRIEVTEAAIETMERIIAEHVPEAVDVQATIGTPGFWSTSGEESGSVSINLVPVDHRTRSSEDIANDLRPHLMQQLPGMQAFARAGGGLWIFSYIRGGDDRVRVEIRGHDVDTADRLAAQVSEILETTEGVTDARPSRKPGGRELRMYVDRDRAADYGLTTRTVAETISTLVQGRAAGVYREAGDEYAVRVRLGDQDLVSVERLLEAPVVLPGGRTVQLGDLVDTSDGRTPQAIERLDQTRIVTVSGGVDGTRDLGAINAELRERVGEIEVPEGFSVLVAGEGEEQAETFSSMIAGFIMALLLVYMVMAGQFESFIQPLVVMLSVPFAAIGVILTLVFTDTTLNLNSFMGIIVLIGVVVNNAIVMVDTINQLREEGMDRSEAVVEGARRRLRPILMTTATTVLALIPVAFGGGTGGEAQAPLARVVVGGLVTSTIITLMLVPSIYGLISRGTRQSLEDRVAVG